MSENTIWIDVLVKVETEKAVLLNNGHIDAWVPKSQIIDMEDELGVGVETMVELAMFVAESKGLV